MGRKLVLFYDPTSPDSLVFSIKSVGFNSDGSTFESIQTQKRYILRNSSGKILGELQMLENNIANTDCKIFQDLFKLNTGCGVPEQYNVITSDLAPKQLIQKFRLTNTKGKFSFIKLKWEWPAPDSISKKRKLTFYKKK